MYFSHIIANFTQTYVSELHQPEFTQFTDAVVSRTGLQEQLGQTHLFTLKQRTHFDKNTSPSHQNYKFYQTVKLRKPTGPRYVVAGRFDTGVGRTGRMNGWISPAPTALTRIPHLSPHSHITEKPTYIRVIIPVRHKCPVLFDRPSGKSYPEVPEATFAL